MQTQGFSLHKPMGDVLTHVLFFMQSMVTSRSSHQEYGLTCAHTSNRPKNLMADKKFSSI